MKKLSGIAAVLLCSALLAMSALLAGCAEESSEVKEILPETVSETAVSEFDREVREKPVKQEDVIGNAGNESPPADTAPPADAHIFVFDDDDPPEIPEFSMSLDGYDDYVRQSIARARTVIKAMLDCSKTGEKPMINFTKYDYIGDCNRLENVKVGSWEVKDEKVPEGYYMRYEVTLTLDVTESESEFMPVGRADYLLIYQPGNDRAFLPLRKAGELDEGNILPVYGENSKAHVDFCTFYTAYFSGFWNDDVITDFSSPAFDPEHSGSAAVAAYIAASKGGGFGNIEEYNYSIPYDVFNDTLRNILGFSADAIDAKNSGCYNEETDCIVIPGMGYGWICGWLESDEEGEEPDTRVVTIDYYEDDLYLIRSQTYRYTLRMNEDGTCSMLKTERLYKSDRGILGGSV